MEILRRLFKKKIANAETDGKEKFSYVTEFKDGYALAIKAKAPAEKGFGGDIVIINDDYEVVEYTEYKYLYEIEKVTVDWVNGYIPVRYRGVYCIFNTDLQEVKGYRYSIIWFCNYHGYECIIVESEDGQGALDKNLKTIFEPNLIEIKYFDNNKLVGEADDNITYIYDIEKDTKIKVDGIIIDAAIYDSKIYYKFKLNEKYGYYNDEFKVIIEADNDKLKDIDDNGNILFIEDGRTGVISIKTGEKKYR